MLSSNPLFSGPFTGEIAALTAACLWMIASLLFERVVKKMSPLEMNLGKNVIALVMFLVMIFFLRESLPPVTWTAFILISLSGVIGIGIGDTAFFKSLQQLGARRALLLSVLSPPLTALFALIFLQEQLTSGAWMGILLTVLGVAWVITEQVEEGMEKETRNGVFQGVMYGVLGAAGMGGGVVLARSAFLVTEIDPIQSATLRLAAGILALLIWAWVGRHAAVSWLKGGEGLGKVTLILVGATFLGTFICLWLQQVSLELAPAGIAQTLLSTSPLFALIPAFWAKERITLRTIIGMVVAVAGVAMLFGLQ